MSRVRIYQPGKYDVFEDVVLSTEASLHVGVVLRLLPGESIILFCGDNREFTATIVYVRKKQVCVHITDVKSCSRESPRVIHLAQAIAKGMRIEFVIQKAVELGVTSISPLLTSRCVVRLDAERAAKKQAQWQAIAIAACEQSGRNVVPLVHPVCDFNDYIQNVNADIKLVLSPEATGSWRDIAWGRADIAVLIGPEGGLSDAEIELAQSRQFQPLCLGPRVLRTETAAIVALSVLQAACGDL